MRYILTLTFIFCSFLSFGQESWSLEKCIEYALENNLSIKTNALNIKTNQEALTLAEHARYPNLNFSASHNYSWGRSIDPFSNTPITQRIQSNNFGLSGNATIYNGMRLTNSIKQSALNIQASEADLESTKNFIVLSLSTAYMNILFGIENLANAQRQVKSLDVQIERTQKLVDAGVLPKNNLLDLQSQKATNELQAVQAENALAIAKLNLKQILQLPADGDFQIVIPAVSDPNTATALAQPASIYSMAESTQPQVKNADLQAESAELGIEIAKANYKPTLSIGYSMNTGYSSAQKELFLGYSNTVIETSNTAFVQDGSTILPLQVVVQDTDSDPIVQKFGFGRQLDESVRGFAGLTLSVPIYNRNQVKNAVANATIQRERARLNAQTVRNDLRQTIEQAYQDALAAGKTYESNKKQVEALEETFRMTQERFNLGVSNITDFNVAQNNLNVAKSNLIRAKYDYILKSKVLDFYMGKGITLE